MLCDFSTVIASWPSWHSPPFEVSTSGGRQLKPTMLMFLMMTLAELLTATCPDSVGLVPEQPTMVLFEPMVAVPWPRLPLTKITAALVPFAAVLNCESVVTTCAVADPPPVVLPFSDANPTGVGEPEMNPGTVQPVAASTSTPSLASSGSPQP